MGIVRLYISLSSGGHPVLYRDLPNGKSLSASLGLTIQPISQQIQWYCVMTELIKKYCILVFPGANELSESVFQGLPPYETFIMVSHQTLSYSCR